MIFANFCFFLINLFIFFSKNILYYKISTILLQHFMFYLRIFFFFYQNVAFCPNSSIFSKNSWQIIVFSSVFFVFSQKFLFITFFFLFHIYKTFFFFSLRLDLSIYANKNIERIRMTQSLTTANLGPSP